MHALKPSSVDSPLAWFATLLLTIGREALLGEFKLHAMEEEGYFMPAYPYTGLNDETWYFVDIEENGEMNTVSYSFDDYCKKRYSIEYGHVVFHLNEHLFHIKKREEKIHLLNMLCSKLNALENIGLNSNLPAKDALL